MAHGERKRSFDAFFETDTAYGIVKAIVMRATKKINKVSQLRFIEVEIAAQSGTLCAAVFPFELITLFRDTLFSVVRDKTQSSERPTHNPRDTLQLQLYDFDSTIQQ